MFCPLVLFCTKCAGKYLMTHIAICFVALVNSQLMFPLSIHWCKIFRALSAWESFFYSMYFPMFFQNPLVSSSVITFSPISKFKRASNFQLFISMCSKKVFFDIALPTALIRTNLTGMSYILMLRLAVFSQTSFSNWLIIAAIAIVVDIHDWIIVWMLWLDWSIKIEPTYLYH